MGNITSACSQPLAFPFPIINAPFCDAGFYCPYILANNSLTWPSICPPTIACQLTRLGSSFCEPQGVFEPSLCPPGSFCPNWTTVRPCQEGTYCPRGSSEPTPCGPMTLCAAGAAMRCFYGGIVMSVLFDLALFALFLWFKFRGEPYLWRRRRELRGEFDEPGLAVGRARAGEFELTAMGVVKAISSFVGVGGADRSSSASEDDQHHVLLTGGEGEGKGGSDGGGGASAVSAPLPLSPSGGSGGGGGGGPAVSAAVAAKAVLEDGFRRCNAGLHMDMLFDGLSLTLPPPTSKTILNNVCGRIRPGRVTAIMGPSGAGKTTFLSVLMGKVARTAGTLRINGAEDEMHRFKRIVGFVPQDDTMMQELTVRENILFSARCRLPRGAGWDDASVQRHVDAVIDVLGLRECADTLSSSVSGGQRKRTNIGMELAMAPAAIFLDEPTSGLDATAALEVCNTLRAVADLGLTVTGVIHQPRLEIFESFDDLLLLAPGGMTVYMGPQRLVCDYFRGMGFHFLEGHNPADDLLDFVAGKGEGSLKGARLAAIADEGPGLRHAPAFASPAFSSASSLNGGLDDSFESQGLSATKPVGAAGLFAAAWSAASGAGAVPSLALPLSPQTQSGSVAASGAFTSPRSVTAAGSALAQRWSVRGLAWVNMHVRGNAAASTPSVLPHPGGELDHIRDHDADGVVVFDIDAISANRGASFLRQTMLVHNRALLQQYRQAPSFALEMAVGLLAGGIMGSAATAVSTLYLGILKPPYTLISPAPMETLLPSIGLYVALAVGLAGSPAGVRTFGEEKSVFYREAASGHDRGAYYLAKTVAVLYRLTCGAFHFAAIFHYFATPTVPFLTMFGLVWLQYYSVYGLAAVTSMLVDRENSALLGVIVSLIAACMCGFGPNLVQGQKWGIRWVQDASYSRWANELWMHTETLAYRRLYLVEEISAPLFGYTLNRAAFDIGMILLIGSVYRLLAFGLLVGLYRSKQR